MVAVAAPFGQDRKPWGCWGFVWPCGLNSQALLGAAVPRLSPLHVALLSALLIACQHTHGLNEPRQLLTAWLLGPTALRE